MTDKQKARLYRRAYDRMREGDGYQMFGYDWITLKLTKPGWYQTLKLILALSLLLCLGCKNPNSAQAWAERDRQELLHRCHAVTVLVANGVEVLHDSAELNRLSLILDGVISDQYCERDSDCKSLKDVLYSMRENGYFNDGHMSQLAWFRLEELTHKKATDETRARSGSPIYTGSELYELLTLLKGALRSDFIPKRNFYE